MMTSVRIIYSAIACLCLAVAIGGCATPESPKADLKSGDANISSEPGSMAFQLEDDHHPGLLDPSKADLTAPDVFRQNLKQHRAILLLK